MRSPSYVALTVCVFTMALPYAVLAQPGPSRVVRADSALRADSVVVTASLEYRAGGLRGFLFGDNYRNLWATPIRVAVLDLKTFAGGLRPIKRGGGLQTQSLRFAAADGEEYVFRTVDKLPHMPPGMEGKAALWIAGDQISAEHPAAALVAAPLLDAAGVLHATPTLVVMSRDTLLGAFATEFSGRLGIIELSPGKSLHGEGFAGAVAIIDSDTLRALLDRDPGERIDARALLTARLMDLFLNDIDRHPGQWKWARLHAGLAAAWQPIPRDRDQAFVSYHGALLSVARLGAPNLVTFDGDISIPALTYNSLEMDRRLLSGLSRNAWDSASAALTARLTDAVIEAAVTRMPAEYRWTAQGLAATLKIRRDHLRKAANTFYLLLASIVDVHGTDAADRLSVTRVEGGFVDVRLESRGGLPYFQRRFDARETREIRVYLHGGDDTSVVVGEVRHSIPVKVIGGNGANWLADSSRVDGESNPSRMFDSGPVESVGYGKDTLFARLPFVELHGKQTEPGRDRGTRLAPDVGITGHRELGLTLRLGLDRYEYGFRDQPYASKIGVEAEYAFALPGFRLSANADKRWEGTPYHVEASAFVSQFEVLGFHGFGNSTSDSASGFFAVRQRQWRVHPAFARAIGGSSDLSIGPVLQYTHTDDTPNRFLSTVRPYGVGNFGDVGMQVALHHEVSDRAKSPTRRFALDVSGAAFPAVWDATAPFQAITARAGFAVTMPIVLRPTLVVRAGGKKLYGTFPFFEAAFIGGNHTLRRMGPQRYAGDAAVYANAELRVPLVSFTVMLPFTAGILGTTESGRVYVRSSSPGGWHSASGGGFWIGRPNQSFVVSCTVTNERANKSMHCQTGLGF